MPSKYDFKLYIIPLLVLFLDQLTKYLFQYKDITLIPYVLLIKYSENPGLIFGIFKNSLIFTIILPIIVILFFIYYAKKHKKERFASLLIITGLLGNLITRLIYGYVIDFIFIPFYPPLNISNFNLADASLISGVIILIYNEIKR